MVAFRFTCPRHQRVFIEAGKRGGCISPSSLDELRKRTLAWLSREYPSAVLEHFNEQSCLGCKLETAYGDLGDVVNGIIELAKRLSAV
ncbi:MAG TPA: hypothetical protein VN668_07620 [Stellaceae bacterium]|nr:hypothetical protein [Stellaceae bacterium]